MAKRCQVKIATLASVASEQEEGKKEKDIFITNFAHPPLIFFPLNLTGLQKHRGGGGSNSSSSVNNYWLVKAIINATGRMKLVILLFRSLFHFSFFFLLFTKYGDTLFAFFKNQSSL